jgi:hypothetical protein
LQSEEADSTQRKASNFGGVTELRSRRSRS